jgi:nucleoside-diphosphate-sugar epimerase
LRIFVTGATGFLGGHLCRHLVAGGHEIVALVRNPKKAATELPPTGVTTFAGDLSIFEQPDLKIPACDLVIHLAGIVAARSPAEYDAVNFGAVKSLVGAIARQSWRPRRFLFASSLAAAGPTAAGAPKTERDPCAPIDPYGRAKLAAEQFLSAEAPFPTTSFRPCIIFGPRDTASLTLFKLAKRGFGFRVAGTPQELSFIDVDDVVRGIAALTHDTGVAHRTYFLASDERITTESLWRAMSETVGRRVRVLRAPRLVLRSAGVMSTGLSKIFRFTNQLDAKQVDQMLAPAWICSSQAAQSATGWKPNVSLAASLSKAWSAYRADGWL